MLIKSGLRLLSRIYLCPSDPCARRIVPALQRITVQSIYTTKKCDDLMEFFEDERNWGKDEVRSGRSWRMDELRLKSNEDLHKLWYVLLKEKNMLLTMEEFYKENYILFPSPERIDKVEESMKNLETVVRERNKAYYMLETGEDGEQPGVIVRNAIGLPVYHRKMQHTVPKYANRWFKKNFLHHFDMEECREFLQLMSEKRKRHEKRHKWKDELTVRGMLRRFKNIDKEYLAELYPNIDVKKISEEETGHFEIQ